MSQLIFQSKFTLDAGTASGENLWDIDITLRDGEGIFRGRDIGTGDVIVLDTGIAETGTYTFYEVVEVIDVSWTGAISLKIRYSEDNDNVTPNPDIGYFVGNDGTIARPSEQRGLLPVVSPNTQGLPDTFSFYTLNHNLIKVLDEAKAQNATLVTAQFIPVSPTGRAELPSEPLGDFVFNMALVFLVDGSMAEILGVTAEFNEDTNKWFAVIPPNDMTALGGQIGALSVSYMTPSSV